MTLLRACPHGTLESLICPACARYVQSVVGATVDGKPGPRTFFAVAAHLRSLDEEAPTSPGTPSALRAALHPARARLLDWAAAWEGECDPDAFWEICGPHMKGDPSGTSWCGGFALAGLVANLPKCKDWRWPRGRGFVLERRLPAVTQPEPGDVAVWRRMPPDGLKDMWHHALVVRLVDGELESIDGNVLRAPKEGVARCYRSVNYGPTSPYRPTFYSIAGLL